MEHHLGDRLPAAPVSSRSEVLDSLRGFALLGILLANFEPLSMPSTIDAAYKLTQFPGLADRFAAWLVLFLCDGKFILIFSGLFGYGVVLQKERAAAEGADFKGRYRRRLFALMAIGFAHAFLLFFGDIVSAYAILGFAMPWFLDKPAATLVAWAAAMWALSIALYTGLGYYAGGGASQGEETLRAIEIHTRGTFFDIVAYHAEDVHAQVALLPLLAPQVLGAFLAGAAAAKAGLLRDLENEQPFWRTVLRIALPVAVIGNLAYTLVLSNATLNHDPAWSALAQCLRELGTPFGSAVYVSLFALLFTRARWRRALAFFAPGGRLSLSNYVGQSLLAAFLFQSWGLALYGKVGMARGVLLALGMYAVLALATRAWLRFARTGPLEWLVRKAAYSD